MLNNSVLRVRFEEQKGQIRNSICMNVIYTVYELGSYKLKYYQTDEDTLKATENKG